MAGYHLTRGGIWVKQPQALVELDADNPICRGLVYVVNPASTNIAYSGSAVRVATPQGIAVQNTTGTTSAGLATGIKNIGGTLIAASTPRSALVVAYVNTFANAPYYYAGLRDASGVEYAYAALLWSNNATAIGLSWNNGFKYVTAPAAGNVIVSGSVPGSGLFASARVCVNGEFPDTTATQDGTPAEQLYNATVNIAGRTTDSIRSLNGHVSLAVFWNRELSEQEHISLYKNPYQIFKPQQRRIWVPVSAGGGQTLSPTLFTNSQSFYAPTITTGAATISPSLFTNDQTFYAATVSQVGGAQTITPTLFQNSQTFYAPTVTPGAVTVTPTLFTNSQSFYAATISQAGVLQTLSPPLFTNEQTFYVPTISVGAVTVTPTLFQNSQTFYTATISQGFAEQTITPTLFTNSQTFYVPVISTGSATVSASLFTNTNTFYTHSITGGVQVESNSNILFAGYRNNTINSGLRKFVIDSSYKKYTIFLGL